MAVCGHPELCDTTTYLHRDRTKKETAWRKVSEEVGLPAYLIPAIGCTFRSRLHLENKHFKSCFACGLADRSDVD